MIGFVASASVLFVVALAEQEENVEQLKLMRRLGHIEYCSTYTDGNGCGPTCNYDSSSCDCTMPDGIDADPHCITCQSPSQMEHGQGCVQCDTENGYFKVNWNYPCQQCHDVFGSECQHCADFNGCQQCIDGYERVIDSHSGMYYCRHLCPEPVPTQSPTSWTTSPSNRPTWSPTPKPSWSPTNPTWSPSPRPTWNPTPPTWSPTPRPVTPTMRPTWHPTEKPTTREPTPRPTWNPTNRPTWRPTPQPSDKPSPRPSWAPTPPTWSPTPKPTNKPTPPTWSPTPKPTWSPTPKPTFGPTFSYCPLDCTMGVRIIVSNGCQMTNDECDALTGFLSDVVEKTYDPNMVGMEIVTHGMNGNQVQTLTGTREQLLAQIDSQFSCNTGGSGSGDETNYARALEVSLNALVGASHFDAKRVVIISTCPHDYLDDVCNVPQQFDPNGVVELTVINGGEYMNNELTCLNPSKKYYCDEISESCLTSQLYDISTHICTKPTYKPTPQPTWNPTRKPTDKPTNKPSWNPTPRPSWTPTNKPTWSPTPKPTNWA